MSYLQQVQRGVDYIEAHLHEELDLRAVSRAAGISHSHFQRIFRALTGETLKAYVRGRRMGGAMELLLSSDARVLDVAVAAGFESQEAFARAFKRIFGMTPSEFRERGRGKLFVKKVRFDERYLEHLHRSVSLQPQLVERDAMRVVGMRTLFYGQESEKNNLGDKLPALWDRFVPCAPDIAGMVELPYYGVVRQDVDDPERLEYFAAVEVRGEHPIPAGMVDTTVPASRYAVFEHRGFARDIDQTVNYIYSTWLLQSGLRHTYGPDLELYGTQWDAESPHSVFHYAIPVAG